MRLTSGGASGDLLRLVLPSPPPLGDGHLIPSSSSESIVITLWSSIGTAERYLKGSQGQQSSRYASGNTTSAVTRHPPAAFPETDVERTPLPLQKVRSCRNTATTDHARFTPSGELETTTRSLANFSRLFNFL